MRGNGGILGPKNAANTSSSVGIWDVVEAQQSKGRSVWPTYSDVSYSLSRSASSVDEGSSVTITLNTVNVANGNIPYTISGTGITSGDFSPATLTGNFNLSSGTASVTLTLSADATLEGAESFLLSLDNGKASISVSINDTSTVATRTFTISPSVSGKSTWNLDTDGPLSLTSASSWTITPTSSFTGYVKMWGAGGGGARSGGDYPPELGGGGGAAVGDVAFSNGVSYVLSVGGGGGANYGGAAGGSAIAPGGTGLNAGNGGGAGGGGATGIKTGSTMILIAGGGGGGGADVPGGAGGGTSGQTYNPGNYSVGGSSGRTVGAGASQSAGGSMNGSYLQGGNASGGTEGGGGGGGYYGGGASYGWGGGGGGSGYYDSLYVSNATLYTGNRQTPGNDGDSVRSSSQAGQGGSAASNGTNGMIYIY